ncbi:MAG: hypothetical protein PHQ12_14620 [Chthoniobacteraceae bacterium]|nr:hypothetical protein [Chthoniobacteraceae bacterium]
MPSLSYDALEAALLDRIARPGSLLADEAFHALALDIFQFQREHNAPYRQFCKYQKTPAEPSDWRQIPAVPTGAFRQAALRAFPATETTVTFRTSGTTGEGYGSHHFRSPRLYEASLLAAWKALELPRLPQILLTQRPGDAPHSSLSHMMGTLGALGEQTWCLDAGGALDLAALRQAAASGPVLVLGTALAFLHVFERLGGERLDLAPGSLAMETGGYKGTGRTLAKAELYTQFGRTLGLGPDAILNEYSMTELSSQWYTRGLGRPHHGPEWTRALVIDPETGREAPDGERGVLRLFDLANLGSVLAIQTQDLAVRRGAGFELLGRDPTAIPRGCSRSADELLNGGR